jgi:dienelactone hydrolase
VADCWKEFSPVHNMKQEMPDAVIFHGLEDSSVPVWTVKDFASRLQDAGADCRLYLYPGQKHGFFNGGDGDKPYFYDTLYRMGRFLEDAGWLEPAGPASGMAD